MGDPVRLPTPTLDAAALVDAVVDAVEAIDAAAGRRTDAVGVGLPGLVDRSGTLAMGPHLPGIRSHPFADVFRARLRRPVVVDNDATCAVWAEHLRRGGPRCDGRRHGHAGHGHRLRHRRRRPAAAGRQRVRRRARPHGDRSVGTSVSVRPARVLGAVRLGSGTGAMLAGGRPGEQVIAEARAGEPRSPHRGRALRLVVRPGRGQPRGHPRPTGRGGRRRTRRGGRRARSIRCASHTGNWSWRATFDRACASCPPRSASGRTPSVRGCSRRTPADRRGRQW